LPGSTGGRIRQVFITFLIMTVSPGASTSSVIDPASVIDLTSVLSADGSLEWKVPAGNWTIMRFGYSLTGSKNRPAVPAGSGYEVDKLSKEHTLAYIKEYTDPIAEALGPLYGKSLQYVMLDSWEAGMQNWTDDMLNEFKKRRGYNLTPYLPCLSGRVLGNSDICDRVLWDFRRTLADMFPENHYAVLTEFLNKQGIKTYGEASGVSLEILEDALLCKKYVDIPMGEFWYRALNPELMYYQDVRGAASASHIYGKNLVAAEAFTGGGFESPYTLKKIGDYWFAQGINRFVFHTSAHQPLDTKPGNTMVGTHINRNITWAEQAEPFMKYLSRNSYMLQQGKFVADLAYLLDEGAPSTMPIWETPVKTVLDKLGVKPDVEYSKPLDSKVDWIHRRAGDTDIYFLVNSTDGPLNTEVRFRITGKEAELWDPATGIILPSGYTIRENSTVVPVHFTERQSLFIVFRNRTDLRTRSFAQPASELLATLAGPWEVSLPAGMGAPEKITLSSLESWTASKDEGVKYFSGTAQYTKTFEVPKSWIKPEMRLMLDVGKVCDVAEVIVNGTQAGILWESPFSTEITGLLKKGVNKIEIKVTNQWTNRLIGDQKAGAGKKVLNSSVFVRGKDLSESGLIGPVTIINYTY
jgi:hypothetical protein